MCEELVNEFEENPRAMRGLYPHMFVTGLRATEVGKGSWSKKLTKRLCCFYDARFAESSTLQLQLFDQHLRHSRAREVKVYLGREGVKARGIVETLNSPEFEAKLLEAERDPDSLAASSILKTMRRHVQVAGKRVKWGMYERASGRSDLYALTQTYGVPSFFIVRLTEKPRTYFLAPC